LQKFKNFETNLISRNTFNLYKTWEFSSVDMHPYNTFTDWYNMVVVTNGMVYTTSSVAPKTPGVNFKYALSQSNDTGSQTYVPTINTYDEDGRLLTYLYPLGNGDTFYPEYEQSQNRINPDGSYWKMVHYGIKRLFYSYNSPYPHTYNSTLGEQAFIFEINRGYLNNGITPGSVSFVNTMGRTYFPYSSSARIFAMDIYDDLKGNLYDRNYTASGKIGDVFYDKGLIIFLDTEYANYFKILLIDSGGLY